MLEMSSYVDSLSECTENQLKMINDAKTEKTKQIWDWGIPNSLEENFDFNSTNVIVLSDDQNKTDSPKQYSPGRDFIANRNKDIIDFEDPNTSDLDLEIVNEVTYRRKKVPYSKEKCEKLNGIPPFYFQRAAGKLGFDLQGKCGRDGKSSRLLSSSIEVVVIDDEQLDLEGHSVHSRSSEICISQEDLNAEFSQENNNRIPQYMGFELSDSKSSKGHQDCSSLKEDHTQTFLRSFVRPECLHDQTSSQLPLNQFTNCKKSSQFSDEDKFLRLIDLTILEKKPSKRCYTSSDNSTTSSSSLSSTRSHSLTKRRLKRQKFSLSSSDVTSFYESSDSNGTDSDSSREDRCYSEKVNEIEEKAMLRLLEESDTSEYSDEAKDSDYVDEREDCRNKKKLTKKKSSKSKKNLSKPTWLDDPLLKFKLPDDTNDLESRNGNDSTSESILGNGEKTIESENSDSSYSEDSQVKTKKKKGKRMRIIESESSDSCFSEDSQEETKNKKGKETTIIDSDSSGSCVSEDSQVVDNHSKDLDLSEIDPKTTAEVATPNSKTTGRRNIRKVLDDQEITENTRQAVKDEESRIERLTERRDQLDHLVSSEDNTLTLDVDKETKSVLVAVDTGLVKLLKPHQKEGVRFMWDCCFESMDRARAQEGSGCILAHCMGLGKTLQIITLVHTLLANPAIPIKTAMIVCPMSTILNWADEFGMWLKRVGRDGDVRVVELTQVSQTQRRISQLDEWQREGGVLIIGYEMFRSFTSCEKQRMKPMRRLLLDPGADLVVCDEGHLLKNEDSQLAQKMQLVRTRRRIILTGTPLQNNLKEYHCMIQFVKPNLLGSKAEFLNRFANPMDNGQYGDSTPHDVKLMKHRAHVLHRLLEGCVQRCDYAVSKTFLPPKQEYVVTVRLSELQTRMYLRYIDDMRNKKSTKRCSLFKNYQQIRRVVAHPGTVLLGARDSKEREDSWWSDLVENKHLEDMSISPKLVLLFSLLDSFTREQDKVLVFSQCLYTLNLVELFLKKLDEASTSGVEWKPGLDYLRLDGKVPSNMRSRLCKRFNDPTNKRTRLFLISTRAGGLGINLTAANRVVVFDPSWNPSSDVQSVFRVFRFGQEKPCYVYRLLAAGTMEEKIYNRQVTKLSLSLRVLDEQQAGRHYRDSDLTALYELETLADGSPAKLAAPPRDRVLGEVLAKYSEQVYNFFEHDSLLENKEEEELDEEERKQAWLEYQREKLDSETKAGEDGQESVADVGTE